MIPVYSAWLAAHGKLWYDDTWYRRAWIVWPQALAAVLVLWFWAMPSAGKDHAWARPVDPVARANALYALREAAKASQPAMNTLERDALGGEMLAQFYFATLYDPDLKLSTIATPDINKALEWYIKAAAQGYQLALSNLALLYSRGTFTRLDYTRACYYALKLDGSAPGNGLLVKGDCYARGLGGTRADQALADAAYQAATAKGAVRPPASPNPPPPAPPPLNPPPPSPPAFSQLPVPAPSPPSQPAPLTDLAWGAIGFTADGSYSTAWKRVSQAEAEATVAKGCAEFGRGACKVISFSGQRCVGLATFIGSYRRRRWDLSFTAGGDTFPEAQSAALASCNSDERSRGRCVFRTAACADGR